MFMRLLTWTEATNVDAGIDYLRDTVLPIVRQQRGYRGISASFEASTGSFSVLSAWETEADREASESALSKARDEGTEIIGGSLRVEKLEEVVRELVRTPEIGCSLMVSPFSLEPASIDENLEFFVKEIAPQIKASPGFCALRNMVNRTTGEGYVGTIWQDKKAMDAQAEQARARRQAAGSRGISFGPLSFREILLIDIT